MKYEVLVVEDAEADLLEIYRYVALNDSLESADQLIDKLEELTNQGLAPLISRRVRCAFQRTKAIGRTWCVERHDAPYRSSADKTRTKFS